MVRSGIAEHVIGIEPLRQARRAASPATSGASCVEGDAAAARAGGRCAHRRDRPARPGLHHLHQRHQRRAARGAAAPRRDPVQRRRRGRSAGRRFRLGRRAVPVVPAAEPRARAHRRAVTCRSALGAEIWFAEGLDKLASNIEEAQPTFMVVVPRLFEVLRGADHQAGREAGPVRRTSCSTRRSRSPSAAPPATRRLTDWPIEMLLDRDAAAQDQRALRRADQGAGLGRRAAQSRGRRVLRIDGPGHAAGLRPDRKPRRWSAATTPRPGSSWTPSARRCAGSRSGSPRTARSSCAASWSCSATGSNQAETAKTIIDGWLHTGDIGHLDERGRIVITDRKKDIIVNDKGDNIAPQKLEGMLTLQPEIAQAMVSGDKRPYVVGADRARRRMGVRMGPGQRREVRPRRAAGAARVPQRGARGDRPGQRRAVGDREGPPVRLRRRAVHHRERAR